MAITQNKSCLSLALFSWMDDSTLGPQPRERRNIPQRPLCTAHLHGTGMSSNQKLHTQCKAYATQSTNHERFRGIVCNAHAPGCHVWRRRNIWRYVYVVITSGYKMTTFLECVVQDKSNTERVAVQTVCESVTKLANSGGNQVHTARKVLSMAENKKHQSRAQNNDTFKKFDGRIENSQKHGLLLGQADHIHKLYLHF